MNAIEIIDARLSVLRGQRDPMQKRARKFETQAQNLWDQVFRFDELIKELETIRKAIPGGENVESEDRIETEPEAELEGESPGKQLSVGRPPIDPELKSEIEALLANGLPNGEVASMAGVHRNTVSKIKKMAETSATPIKYVEQYESAVGINERVNTEFTASELEAFKNRLLRYLQANGPQAYSRILSGAGLSPMQFNAVIKLANVEKDDGMWQIKKPLL